MGKNKFDFGNLKEIYNPKLYRHFDKPLSRKNISKLLDCLSSERFYTNYRHYPFINYNIKFRKYLGHGKFKTKSRPISLPSHRDALMFKAYSVLLNDHYEEFLNQSEFNDVPIAYRRGKSNISGAKEIFDFIWDNPDCWILKADFKSFFDTLDHKILKKNLCTVLGQEKLPENWYHVFKFLTKHKSVLKSDLGHHTNLQSKYTPYVKNGKELSDKIKSNELKLIDSPKKGIPQGTALSAILANVYMISFDSSITKIISHYNGIYRRYSDDFIIVLPDVSKTTAFQIRDILFKLCELQKLTIEREKTKIFHSVSKGRTIYSHLDSSNYSIKPLDFLGFLFDGKFVHMRSKSIYKYHYRGKRTTRLMDNFFNDRKLLERNEPLPYLSARTRLSEKDHREHRDYRLRKQAVQLYLSTQPLLQRNMQSYAKRVQNQLSSGRYEVRVLKQVQKQISYFRKRGWKK